MAFARLYLPYSGAGSEHDPRKWHRDVIRVITGATTFDDMELAITGGESRIVTTTPAGWELVRTAVYDTSINVGPGHLSSSHSTFNPVVGSIASLIRAPIDGFTDRYKYVTMYTYQQSANEIFNVFQIGEIDDGTTPFCKLSGSFSGYRQIAYNPHFLRRNISYYLDISVSARHISINPIDLGYGAVGTYVFERTRNFPEDDPSQGFVPMVAFRGSGEGNTLVGCRFPIPLEDNGSANAPLEYRFGAMQLNSLSTMNPTAQASFVKGGERRYLFLKPTVYVGILALGDIHPDIPIYWASKVGQGLSSYQSGSSFLVDGKEFIIHNQAKAEANVSHPIFIEVK